MKKLLRYLGDYKKETVLAPAFKLMEALLELFVPLVVASIIDAGIGGGDVAYVGRMVLVLVLLGVVGMAFSVTGQYFSAKAACGFAKKVRHVLFSHIQQMSYGELDEAGASTLITRMTSDMNQVQAGINLTLRLLLRSPFVIIGAMVMAFTVDSRAALVFVVDIPVLALVVFAIMFASIPLYRKVQGKLDKVTSLTRENLSGVRVLRAFCKEEEQAADFKEKNGELTSTQTFVGRIMALLNPITYIIINAAIIALIYVGAIRVSTGLLTQGAVVALYNYMAQILTEMVKLANLIINITRSIACGNRIEAVLEGEVSENTDGDLARTAPVTDAAAQTAADAVAQRVDAAARTAADGFARAARGADFSVEFRHVHFSYPHASGEALTDIDFKAEPGQTIGIIGATGSGKSSLVNLIPGFYGADSGKVLVGGVDVKDWDKNELRENIGLVPQKAVLFAGTIRDNLLWGKADATADEMEAAVQAAQAADIIKGKEAGLGEMVEQGGRNFSGGQRQRLTIARALVRRPKILILDDSSSALDYATDAALRRAIGSLDYHPTVFIVSQRTSSIRHADQIIVLDDGRMVGLGNHGELMESCEIYRQIDRIQFPDDGTGRHLPDGGADADVKKHGGGHAIPGGEVSFS